MSQMHEELEIGDDMDRMVRTALTGVAQLVERAARSGAERDRAAAQALREQLLMGRQSPQQRGAPTRPGPTLTGDQPRPDSTVDAPDHTPDPTPDDAPDPTPDDALDERARQYLEQAPAGPDAGRTAAAWETAIRDVAADPTDPAPAAAAAQLNRHSRERHGVDLAATVAAAVSDLEANVSADAASTRAAVDARAEVAQVLAGASPDSAVPLVMRTSDTDLPVLATGGPVRGADGAHYVPTVAGAHVPVDDLVLPSRAALGYVPAWEADDGQVDRAVFDQLAGPSAGPPVVRVVPANRNNPDRGVSPSKAATPDEATHRRQTWALARGAWEADADNALPSSPAARQATWDKLPMPTKTELFWKHYDTEQARTLHAAPGTPTPARVGSSPAVAASERGMAPTKAATAEERTRRESAWALAEQGHANDLPAGTSREQAQQAWKELEWQERGLRYWTAYDDPSVAAGKAAPAASAGASMTRDRVIELNGQAADYFTAQATPASKGGEYLESRLGAEVLSDEKWRLGYAPEGWTNLTDHLRSAGASDDEIVSSGLGLRSSRGNVVDAFRDRATVGIRDQQGEVVGFVGRDLSGSPQAPKYVNTGGTPAYTKGDHVLGLYEAGADARLVRVEGPFDAIATTAAGQGRYAGVAPLGTALTDTQATAIAERAGGRVWEALDGDRGGSKATEADFWALSEKGVETRLLAMPAGSDPAELWQNNPDRLRDLLNDADSAPTAGVAVIDNALEELRPGLRDGEALAHEELAAVHDKVAGTLTTDTDREQLSSHTTSSVDALLERADQTRDEAHRLDALDDAAEIAADRAPTAAREDDLEATADRAVTGREQAAGRAGDFEAEAKTVATDQAAATRYDRGTVTPGGDVTPEAVQARQASAAGFSRPTREMLGDAQQRSGTPARPAKPNAQTLGRPRSQRR